MVSEDAVLDAKPAAVSTAVVLVGFLAIGTAIIALISLILPTAIFDAFDRRPLAPAAAFAYLTAALICGICLYFVSKGFGVARWPLVVLGVLGLANLAISHSGTGSILLVMAVVMLFLTESNAWFRTKKAERAAAA